MIKAVISDVGGVLIRTVERAQRDEWAARLGLAPAAVETLVFNSQSGRAAQQGQKSPTEHWRWLGDQLGLDAAETAQMRQDFFAGDALNEALLAHLQRLQQAGFAVGLLSNFAADARQLWADAGLLTKTFDSVIISAEAGVMKPEPRIYQLALAELDVAPAAALFIDDFKENIAGAERLGLQTLHFKAPAEAQQTLATLTGVA